MSASHCERIRRLAETERTTDCRLAVCVLESASDRERERPTADSPCAGVRVEQKRRVPRDNVRDAGIIIINEPLWAVQERERTTDRRLAVCWSPRRTKRGYPKTRSDADEAPFLRGVDDAQRREHLTFIVRAPRECAIIKPGRDEHQGSVPP